MVVKRAKCHINEHLEERWGISQESVKRAIEVGMVQRMSNWRKTKHHTEEEKAQWRRRLIDIFWGTKAERASTNQCPAPLSEVDLGFGRPNRWVNYWRQRSLVAPYIKGFHWKWARRVGPPYQRVAILRACAKWGKQLQEARKIIRFWAREISAEAKNPNQLTTRESGNMKQSLQGRH